MTTPTDTTGPDLDLLTLLADKLETVPRDHFDLRDWWLEDGRGRDRTEVINLYTERGDLTGRTVCGYAGCAMGHAAQMPEFQRRGLSLDELDDHRGVRSMNICYLTPGNKLRRGFSAVESLFNIDFDQALHLFHADSYPADEITDPAAVARRIREFVANVRQARKEVTQ